MELNKIIGHISQDNIDTLQNYAKLVAKGKEKLFIADIGTCAEKSAISLALADEKIEVLTVDPSPSRVLRPNLHKMKVNDRIIFFKETSDEFAKRDIELDMCFIDGIHSYQGVKDDIKGIVTKVKKDGYVLFHDANLYDGVRKAIKEYEGKYYKFIEETGGQLEPVKEGSIYVAKKL